MQAKKNLGLMKMQCKDVYVAYVSMGTNPAKLLQNAPLRIKARYGNATEEVVYKMTYTMVFVVNKMTKPFTFADCKMTVFLI